MRDDQEAMLVLIEKSRHREEFRQASARPGTPVYLRDELRVGWRAPLPLYVIHCAHCNIFSVSHPAGYDAKVRCHGCGIFGTVPEHAVHSPRSPWSIAGQMVSQPLSRARAFTGLGDVRLPSSRHDDDAS